MSSAFPFDPDSGRTRVKICGLRTVEHVRVAVECGTDAIGIVRHAASPRHVELDLAADLASATGPDVAAVAVVVAPSDRDVALLVQEVGVDAIQVHGDVPEAALLGWRAAHPATVFVRALRIPPHMTWPVLHARGAHAVLVDADVEGSMGGTGVTLDWQTPESDAPVILAGGLTPENVAAAIVVVQPAAVDVSSGVEIRPGVKDPELMEAFVRAVRDPRSVS